ncbi:hypothetical protein QBC46DRAFT_338706 [Diplogelasinospora grovesii]|uniref:Uncharacterized protein n=1 Tax=Diplogelasinospora grovesii TaxID=303347 RepID=A0AAN6S7T2_9PEZI|nr:hypothetical protein QBC46DRAFT_338706 [Diplogelasinospora grovesii]
MPALDGRYNNEKRQRLSSTPAPYTPFGPTSSDHRPEQGVDVKREPMTPEKPPRPDGQGESLHSGTRSMHNAGDSALTPENVLAPTKLPPHATKAFTFIQTQLDLILREANIQPFSYAGDQAHKIKKELRQIRRFCTKLYAENKTLKGIHTEAEEESNRLACDLRVGRHQINAYEEANRALGSENKGVKSEGNEGMALHVANKRTTEGDGLSHSGSFFSMKTETLKILQIQNRMLRFQKERLEEDYRKTTQDRDRLRSILEKYDSEKQIIEARVKSLEVDIDKRVLETENSELIHLRSGLAIILDNMIRTNSPKDKETLVQYVTNLGAVPGVSNASLVQATGFWEIRDTWTLTSISPTSCTLGSTIEERFAKLLVCIMSGFETDDHAELIELITSLLRADHSLTPRAGLAFLRTMAKINLPEKEYNTRELLVAVMIYELCRVLETTFTEIPNKPSGIARNLGEEVQVPVKIHLIGKLAAALHGTDRDSMSGFKEKLIASCGDQLCVLNHTDATGKKHELGFLHCGGNEHLLLINFTERVFRLVDRQLASWKQNESEPRKLDLIIARPNEELLRMAAAPGKAASFWLEYAMQDVEEK